MSMSAVREWTTASRIWFQIGALDHEIAAFQSPRGLVKWSGMGRRERERLCLGWVQRVDKILAMSSTIPRTTELDAALDGLRKAREKFEDFRKSA